MVVVKLCLLSMLFGANSESHALRAAGATDSGIDRLRGDQEFTTHGPLIRNCAMATDKIVRNVQPVASFRRRNARPLAVHSTSPPINAEVEMNIVMPELKLQESGYLKSAGTLPRGSLQSHSSRTSGANRH